VLIIFQIWFNQKANGINLGSVSSNTDYLSGSPKSRELDFFDKDRVANLQLELFLYSTKKGFHEKTMFTHY